MHGPHPNLALGTSPVLASLVQAPDSGWNEYISFRAPALSTARVKCSVSKAPPPRQLAPLRTLLLFIENSPHLCSWLMCYRVKVVRVACSSGEGGVQRRSGHA